MLAHYNIPVNRFPLFKSALNKKPPNVLLEPGKTRPLTVGDGLLGRKSVHIESPQRSSSETVFSVRRPLF